MHDSLCNYSIVILGYEDLCGRQGIADDIESCGEVGELLGCATCNLSATEVVDIHDPLANDAATLDADSIALSHGLCEAGLDVFYNIVIPGYVQVTF